MSTFNLRRFRAGMYPTVFDVYEKMTHEDKPLNIEVTGRDIAEARSKFKAKYGPTRYDLERILFIPNTEKTKAKQMELSQKRLMRKLNAPKTPAEEAAIQRMWDIAP